MSFRRVKGKTKNVYLPVTPSTAIAAGALVTFSSGKLVAAAAATPAAELAGVLKKAITATDDDYADDRRVAVEVPVEPNVQWEFLTSGLVAGDIGNDVDLTDSVTVNRAASAVGVVRPLRRITATKGVGLVKINGAY
jgi:cobalamin biosynthesis protein CbiD